MASEQTLAIAQDARDRSQSVTQDDMANGTIRWVFPTFGLGQRGRGFSTLPENVPAYTPHVYFRARDSVLLSTPFHEGMWADAVNIATTKTAAWDWEVESPIPIRRKRLQNILLQSSAGIFNGWVPFITAHLRSFLLAGISYVEIERETAAYTSRIKALHHLNPLRCQITDNPREPVLYFDRLGREHALKAHQVMIFGDGVDPTLGEKSLVESSAQRAYHSIILLSAIQTYLYEKVTGKRPLELNFVQGITNTHLTDAIKTTDEERRRGDSMLYMGVAVQAIPGDVPIQKVNIPLSGLPDNFDPQLLRDDAYIKYANAIGLDVNDLDPRLAVRSNLGSGAQAVILDQKSKGRGLVAWKKQWIHQLGFWVADMTTKFIFSEETPDDQDKQATIDGKHIKNTNDMVSGGIITTEQGKNLLVDESVLPREFLEEDVTGGETLDDDDKQSQERLSNEIARRRGERAREQQEDDPRENPRLSQEPPPPNQNGNGSTQQKDNGSIDSALLRARTAMNAAELLTLVNQSGELPDFVKLNHKAAREAISPEIAEAPSVLEEAQRVLNLV